jgi:hypothetical protein
MSIPMIETDIVKQALDFQLKNIFFIYRLFQLRSEKSRCSCYWMMRAALSAWHLIFSSSYHALLIKLNLVFFTMPPRHFLQTSTDVASYDAASGLRRQYTLHPTLILVAVTMPSTQHHLHSLLRPVRSSLHSFIRHRYQKPFIS